MGDRSADEHGRFARWWRSRIRTTVALVLVVVAGVAGFFIGRSDEPDPPPEPTPLIVDLGGPGRYVALGDSYSAGEGLPPWEPGTQAPDNDGDGCHRSSEYAYAVRLTFVHDTARAFRACSGAKVANVYDRPQEHGGHVNQQGLQVEPDVTGDDVLLLTLSMGGNDMDFAKILEFCLERSRCASAPYKDHPTLDEWVTAHIPPVKDALAKLYEKLRTDFPRARILVLGYPALFPEGGAPPLRLQTAQCNALFELWSSSERQAIRDWGVELNQAVQTATEAAGAADAIEFVDVLSHFAGHETCTASGPWIRFVGVDDADRRAGWFHPTERGQAMMARIVSCHLTVFPAADTPRTATTGFAMTGCVADQTTLLHDVPPAATTVPGAAR